MAAAVSQAPGPACLPRHPATDPYPPPTPAPPPPPPPSHPDAKAKLHPSPSHPPPSQAYAKAQLQREAGLPVDPKAPLFGFIGRLEEQKGVDVLIAALKHIPATANIQVGGAEAEAEGLRKGAGKGLKGG